MEPDTETRSKEHGTRHPDSDIIQRPAQRNMGPDTDQTRHRDPLKGTWNQTQRPAQRNMGRDIQTVTSYRDPLKGTWDQTQRPTQRNMGHPDSDIIQRPAQRNMGPDTETHSKEHGTRHRDPLKGT